jgi:hypothetical protein
MMINHLPTFKTRGARRSRLSILRSGLLRRMDRLLRRTGANKLPPSPQALARQVGVPGSAKRKEDENMRT